MSELYSLVNRSSGAYCPTQVRSLGTIVQKRIRPVITVITIIVLISVGNEEQIANLIKATQGISHRVLLLASVHLML